MACRVISQLSKVDETGINVIGKCYHMQLKLWSLMQAPNICRKTFLCCNNSSQWSDKFYISITVGAKTSSAYVLTCFLIRLFLHELCHFAETLPYHLAISAMLHTISHFYKWADSFIRRVSARSDLEFTVGWFLQPWWWLEELCGLRCWNPIGAPY